MSDKNPKMWIMKITPGGSGNTKMYFENLFVKEGCRKLIGYSKDSGDKIEEFYNLWKRIKIGDLVVILEGFNRIFGVVEITSDHFDDEDENGDSQSDWFYHRRKAELVKYFNPHIVSKSNTNRNTIIEYSGEGAVDICDMVWNQIKDEYWKNKYRKKMNGQIELLRYKKQIILQGPPGTGKTRLAKEIAQELTRTEVKLTPLEYIDWYIKNFKVTQKIHQTNINIKNTLKTFTDQFPLQAIKNLSLDEYCMGKGSTSSFCYWIERGLKDLGRFSPGPAGTTVYGIYFSQEDNAFISTSKTPEELLKDIQIAIADLIENENYIQAQKLFRKSFILKILNSYYPEKYFPIVSQNHLKAIGKILKIDTQNLNDIEINLKINNEFDRLKQLYGSQITNFNLMRHLYHKFKIKENDFDEIFIDAVDELGETKLIQFHPAYSYEDFVRGITAETNDHNQIEYKVIDKILADFSQKALLNPPENYVLIIDEINRANLPSVLGELIYALEYRYDHEKLNDKEASVESMYYLKRSDKNPEGDNILMLPTNLYIIGTMNTADRSVGHIDYAIRRRFAFVDILPIQEPVHPLVKATFIKISNLFIKNYNGTVQSVIVNADTLASDFRAEDVWLGHSYFICKDEDGSDRDNLEAEPILKMKMKYEVIPILKEYIKDGILIDNDETKKILGELLIEYGV